MITSYIGKKRELYLEVLKKKLKSSRFEHTLRTEKKALELAKRFSVDLSKAQTAALLHDILKNISEEEKHSLISKYNIGPIFEQKGGENLLHGELASYYIKDEFQIDDEDIINAVKNHTAGRANMSKLEKIIYLADLIEDGRDFPSVDKIRKAAEENLDEAVFMACSHTIQYLVDSKMPILGGTIEMYNDYTTKMKGMEI